LIFLLFINVLISTPISKISFEGNQTIKNRELYQIILSRPKEQFSELNLIQDAKRIVHFYESRGFFQTRVEPEVETVDTVLEITYKIYEGMRPKIKDVRFYNGEQILYRFLEVEKGDYFLQERIKKSMDNIEAYYKDRGYAFAKVRFNTIPDSGVLIFEIQKENIYYIKEITIKGIKFCNQSVIRQEIEIKPGDIYSGKKIQNSRMRIYRLGFFNMVNVEIVKVSEDTLNLIFNVQELKSRILNWGIGVSLPLSFIISIGLEELNLFNAGHRLKIQPSFRMNIEKEWETKFEILYSIPYFTKLRLSPSLLPFYWYEDKKDFIRRTWGSEFRISRVFNENVQANIANKYKYFDISMKKDIPDTFSGTTNSLRMQLMYDYRNEFFNPSSGIYFVPVIEYAGGIFGGSNHYLRFETEIRYFQSIIWGKKNILAQRLHLGVIIPTDGVSLDEKFSLGGQYTLRGYDEKSIGPDSLNGEHYGEVVFNFNIEDRLTLYKSIGLVLFFDIGYLDNRDKVFRRDYLKAGTGMGIRYYTPIGPIRGDLGIPLNKKGWQFYLGIYHIF
jgi:outer membrane protein insertion porin family